MAMNMDAMLRIKADVQGGNKIVELNRGLRSVEGAAKGVSGAIRGLSGASAGLSGALGALAPLASVAGLVGLAKGALDAGDKMYDLSQSTGVSVEALARFKKAAATSGTDIDAVAKGLVKLSRGLVETATTGKGKAAEALRFLGISATDASGNLKEADQVTLEIANKFKALPDGAIKTATAVNLFGRSGADLVPLLNLGGNAIDKLSVKLNTAFAEKADAYNDKLAALSGKVGALGADLLILLLPALDKITDAVSGAISAFNDLPAPVKNFAVAGAAVAIAWGPASTVVRGAIGIFAGAGAAAAGATPKVIALGNAMAALAGRLAILAAAVRLVNGIGASVANIGEIGALNRRQAAGGAAAQFKGADRATVEAAKKNAEATLKQIAAERGRQNKIWNAVNPIGIQDRKERELLLQKRENAARAIAGLDPSKYREATTLTGGNSLEDLKAAMDGSDGKAKKQPKGPEDITEKEFELRKALAVAKASENKLDEFRLEKEIAINDALKLRETPLKQQLAIGEAELNFQKQIEDQFKGYGKELVDGIKERVDKRDAEIRQYNELRIASGDLSKDEVRQLRINERLLEIKRQYPELYARQKEEITQLVEASQGLTEVQQRNKDIVDGIAGSLGGGLTSAFDALISGTKSWGESLREIGSSVLQDIAKQLIKILIIDRAISAFKSIFNPTSGTTGTIPVAAVAANGMVAANGIQPFAMGGIVDRPTLFKFASGGTMQNGLMGEAGPEAILPLKRGAGGKLGVAGGGGSTTINVSVDAKGTSMQGDSGKGNQLARVISAAVQEEMIKQKRPGGILAS